MTDTTTTNPVEAAQEQGVFDVLSFVKKTAYPTKEVVVFQDVESADKYLALTEERFELDTKGQPTKEIDAQLVEVGDKIRESSIIFHLRGMPPGIVREILDRENVGDQEKDDILIAHTIVKVTNHKGDADSSVWDAEKVRVLRDFLKEGEFAKLIRGVGEVNLNAVIFDHATDAGFSR